VTTRRQFLKAIGVGAAGLTAAPLLEGCGSSSSSKSASASSPASAAGAAPTSSTPGSAGSSATSAVATSAAAAVTGHVSLGFFGASDIIKAWTPIFADFRKTHPGITLDAVPVPAATWTAYADSVILQLSGGREFDVVQSAVNVQQLFVSKGVVAPLDDLITRDKAELAGYFADENQKFLGWNTSLVSKDGKTYYLPADYNSYCAWVNTKMFQDAGVPIPTNDWTWDDLMAAGAKICTSPGKFLIDVDPGDMFFFQPWALTNGGTLLNADWTKSTLADPKTIEAAAFAQSLCQKGYSPKPGGSFDAVTAFAQDKLAIFGCGMWLNPSIKAAGAASKVKVVAWPQKTTKGTSVGWNAYPIMKKSKNQEAAWAFVKYLSSESAVTNLAATGQSCPGRKSVFFGSALKAASPEPGIDELWNAVSYATPVPSPDAADAINAAVIKTLTQLYSSSTDATQLMTALDKQVTGYLSGT
jgi:multiple sugar transport system substrate-binding protein